MPESIEKLESGKLLVTMKNNESGEVTSDEFDTVMLAIGREPCTKGIGLENVNVELAKNGKVIVKILVVGSQHVHLLRSQVQLIPSTPF